MTFVSDDEDNSAVFVYLRQSCFYSMLSGRLTNIVLLPVLLLAVACGLSPRDRVTATLNEVESYINEHPDSALTVLRTLDGTASYRGSAQRARASLLHTIALDKCYIDLQTDSIIAPAVAWYDRHGTVDEKLKALYYLGRIQYNAKKYQLAIVTYSEALEFADKATDLRYVGLVNQAIADTYSGTYQGFESFPYLDKAFECFIQVPDSSLAKKTLYKKALSLSGQKKWKEADTLFCFLIDNPAGVEEILPRIKADKALSLILNYSALADQSVALFRDVLSSTGSLPTLNHWGGYAYALLKNGETTPAKSIFNQLENQYPADEQVQYWLAYEKAAEKDYEEAYDRIKKTLFAQDSLLRVQLKQSTMEAQKEFFSNKAAQEQMKSRKRTLLLWLTLVSSVLVLLLAWLVARHRRKVSLRDEARLMLTLETTRKQNARLEQETKSRGEQMSLLFQDYFKTLGQICADYEEGQINHYSVPDRVVLRRIDRIVSEFRGDTDGHMAFESQLDKHLNNIMTRFREDYPKMKPQAYLLVSYIFAGIDMQTTSVLMGLDIDALYARKYRIKTMISSSETPNKDEYLSYFG